MLEMMTLWALLTKGVFALSLLVSFMFLANRYYYDLHFTNEETNALQSYDLIVCRKISSTILFTVGCN